MGQRHSTSPRLKSQETWQQQSVPCSFPGVPLPCGQRRVPLAGDDGHHLPDVADPFAAHSGVAPGFGPRPGPASIPMASHSSTSPVTAVDSAAAMDEYLISAAREETRNVAFRVLAWRAGAVGNVTAIADTLPKLDEEVAALCGDVIATGRAGPSSGTCALHAVYGSRPR